MSKTGFDKYPTLPNQLPSTLRDLASEPPETVDSEIESVIVGYVLARDQDAKARSQDRRSIIRQIYRARFAEHEAPAGDANIKTYQVPVVGWKANTLAERVVMDICPDPQSMDFFSYSADPSSYTTLDPESIYTVAQSMLGFEILMRGILRKNNTYDEMMWAAQDYTFTGNSVAVLEWKQTIGERAKKPEEIVQEVMEDLSEDDIYGDGEIEPPDESVVYLAENGPRLQVIDQRNLFPSSFQCDGGVPELDWVTLYSTTTWRHIVENRVRMDNGQKCGSYENWNALRPSMERPVPEIYWDDFDYSYEAATPRTDERYWNLVNRLPVTTYIGCWNWENLQVGGEFPDAGMVNALLKKFGNNPKSCKRRRWWIIEVVDGRLIRFQPYPYFNGSSTPFIHARMYRRKNRTFGEGMYKAMGACDELWNWFNYLEATLAERAANGTWGIDRNAIEQRWLNQFQGNWTDLLDSGVVPLESGNTISQAMQYFGPDPESLQAIRAAKDSLMSIMDTFTGINATVEGNAPVSGTATGDSLRARAASNIIALHSARFGELFVKPYLIQCARLVRDYSADQEIVPISNHADINRLADYDEETSEQLYTANAEKRELAMPFLKLFELRSFSGDFAVELQSVSNDGGRAMRSQGLSESIGLAGQLSQQMPGRANFERFLIQFMRLKGVENPEQFFYTPQQQEANMMQNASMQQMSGGGGGEQDTSTQGMGTPAAPPKNYNPMAEQM